MKKYITKEQVNELSEEAKKKLIAWWKPEEGDYFLYYGDEVFYGELSSGTEAESYEPDKVYLANSAGEGKEQNLPLLSIGQMIEFLNENFKHSYTIFCNSDTRDGIYWEELVGGNIKGKIMKHIKPFSIQKEEICDALWELVKQILMPNNGGVYE